MCPIQHAALIVFAGVCGGGLDFAEYGYVALDSADRFPHEDSHDYLVS